LKTDVAGGIVPQTTICTITRCLSNGTTNGKRSDTRQPG